MPARGISRRAAPRGEMHARRNGDTRGAVGDWGPGSRISPRGLGIMTGIATSWVGNPEFAAATYRATGACDDGHGPHPRAILRHGLAHPFVEAGRRAQHVPRRVQTTGGSSRSRRARARGYRRASRASADRGALGGQGPDARCLPCQQSSRPGRHGSRVSPVVLDWQSSDLLAAALTFAPGGGP